MKILIAEDDRKLAQFLTRVLVEEGYVADVATSGSDALAQAGSGLYDVLILDWMLPGIDGLEVCRRLRAGGLTIPVLMLTARSEVGERVLGLNAGADDYLGKPFDVAELLARVAALLRRVSGHARMTAGPLTIDQRERRVFLDGRELELTQREFALLLHLVHHRDRMVSRSDLLASVWSTGFDPESNVVEVHMSRLRNKLAGHAAMIQTVRGRGYRLQVERDA